MTKKGYNESEREKTKGRTNKVEFAFGEVLRISWSSGVIPSRSRFTAIRRRLLLFALEVAEECRTIRRGIHVYVVHCKVDLRLVGGQ